MKPSGPRGHLETERANPRTLELDQLGAEDALERMFEEDARVAAAVQAARPSIARAVDLIAARLTEGGRLFYVGAGTSGRIGLLDAVECPPTFQSPPGQVQAILAGGDGAFLRSVEGAEDDPEGAFSEFESRSLGARDVVFGITAGGTTPFVHGAIARARELGAATVFFACVPTDQVADEADVSIRVLTGPEVLAGSTRLKAGTATKLVLNAVSTLTMTRLGKVHGNLMVDLNASSNAKLVERGIRILTHITGASREEAHRRLVEAAYQVKLACVMQSHGVDARAGQRILDAAGGVLRSALQSRD